MGQGVYALVLENQKDHPIQIGNLGNFPFLSGLYIYVGSALGKTSTNLCHRLKRHLSRKKKLFWHIDFFLNSEFIKIIAVIYSNTSERKECAVASTVSQLYDSRILAPKFGASDCKQRCGSHLFYFILELKSLIDLINSIFIGQNLKPITKFHDELILELECEELV